MWTGLVWLRTGISGGLLECDNEASGSIKYWETIEWLATGGVSSSAQLFGVSYLV
jgi:hypothetical protein